MGSWIGYVAWVNKTRSYTQTFNSAGRLVDVRGECKAPHGSNLLVITVEGLEIRWDAFQATPTNWFVDGDHNCTVASGHIVVTCPALAGSTKHGSERYRRDYIYMRTSLQRP